MHILASGGYFSQDGLFYTPFINVNSESLIKLVIYKIFKMLISNGLITERIVDYLYLMFR